MELSDQLSHANILFVCWRYANMGFEQEWSINLFPWAQNLWKGIQLKIISQTSVSDTMNLPKIILYKLGQTHILCMMSVGIFSGKYSRSIFEHIKTLRIAFISGQGSAASAFRPSSLDVIQTSWTPHFLKSLEFNPVPCHFKPQTSPISPSPLLLDIGCSRICYFSYGTTCWNCIRYDRLIQI